MGDEYRAKPVGSDDRGTRDSIKVRRSLYPPIALDPPNSPNLPNPLNSRLRGIAVWAGSIVVGPVSDRG
jgi:hypothetical protein